ncbi:MAG: 4Fe-4S binding protein [bacterium]
MSKHVLKSLHFREDRCDFCGCCVAVCPVDCIELQESKLAIDFGTCTLCGNCPRACPVQALVGESS